MHDISAFRLSCREYMAAPPWLNQAGGKLASGCEMPTDQAERSIERMCAEIARLQVLNQCEADLAWALAHMFDVPEAQRVSTECAQVRTGAGSRCSHTTDGCGVLAIRPVPRRCCMDRPEHASVRVPPEFRQCGRTSVPNHAVQGSNGDGDPARTTERSQASQGRLAHAAIFFEKASPVQECPDGAEFTEARQGNAGMASANLTLVVLTKEQTRTTTSFRAVVWDPMGGRQRS